MRVEGVPRPCFLFLRFSRRPRVHSPITAGRGTVRTAVTIRHARVFNLCGSTHTLCLRRWSCLFRWLVEYMSKFDLVLSLLYAHTWKGMLHCVPGVVHPRILQQGLLYRLWLHAGLRFLVLGSGTSLSVALASQKLAPVGRIFPFRLYIRF